MTAATPLLIPGNMCDARLWGEGLAEILDPALGKKACFAEPFFDDSIAAMAERLLDSHNSNLIPIGFSMGAIIAMEVAVLAPERVSAMVLSGYNAGADLPERAAKRPEHQAMVRAGELDAVVTDLMLPHYFATARTGDAALSTTVLAMARNLGADVFVRQSEALRLRESRLAALADLAMPVLFLVGVEDRLCPPEWHLRWAEATPNAALHVVPNAGHMVPMERPAAFAAAIADWAKELTL